MCGSNDINTEATNKVNSYVEEQLNQIFENLGNIDFNQDIPEKDKQLLTKGVKLLRPNYNSYKNWRLELTNRIKSLNEYLLLLKKYSSDKNGASIQEYNIALEKLNSLLNETYEKTWKNISETGLPVNRKTTKNLINEINKLIQEYAAMPIIDAENQMLFEKALNLIPAIGEENLDETIAAQIKDSLTGEKSKVEVTIDKKNFQERGWKMQLGDIYETGIVSKDNIAITHEWNNEILNVVAKKLNLGNGYKLINLSSNLSLLALLQEANSEFVNHYLNLFTVHSDRAHVHYQQQRDEFIPVLKLWLAYKSLSGEGINDNLANVYVINKKDKVEVFSIANFLKEFEKNEGKFISVKINGGGNWKNLYSNTWVQNSPSGIARISHVLQEVHARKIAVSFNSSLINI